MQRQMGAKTSGNFWHIILGHGHCGGVGAHRIDIIKLIIMRQKKDEQEDDNECNKEVEHWHALHMHGRKTSTPFGLALPDVPHPKGSV